MRKVVVAAACAATLAACRTQPGRTSPPAKPHILLVTIDTMRADRLGVGVAPALDALAHSGLWFTHARSTVPLTQPSHTTILTGLLPPAHGVRQNGVDVLAARHQTLATILGANGYQTAAFVGAFVLDRRSGLAQGFDVYDDRIPREPAAPDRLEAERPAGVVVDAALTWLEGHFAAGTQKPAPVFAWIHLYDPHAPYNPPARFLPSASSRSEERYDGEVAYADSQIARVFEWLKQRNLVTRTAIIVAGDHGEGLGEHGEKTHGMLLYDATLRVPLVISAPDAGARRVDDPVSLVDIAPTVLELAGIAVPMMMSGRSLLSGESSKAADVYAETEYPRVAGWSPLQALTDGRWKIIRAAGSNEVYDVRNDPREQHDAASAQPAVGAAMAARLETIRSATASESSTATISAEVLDRLRALGYVASTSTAAASAGAPNPVAAIADWNAFEEALSTMERRPVAALSILERLSSRYPAAPIFQSTYARALKDSGRLTAALAVYRRATREWSTDAILLHDLAVAARDAGELDEARNAELAAAALGPNNAAVPNGLGLLAVDQGRLADAIVAFQRATSLDPGNATYWVNLGNARRGGGDSAGALQAYEKALETDPRNADAANGQGVLLVEAGRPAEAAAFFERALSAQPDFVEARLNLGIALQESGDSRGADNALRAVLAAPGGHQREKDAARRLLAAMRAAR